MRTCSGVDACGEGAACVGGRCEARGLPARLAEAERLVLVPTRARYVELGGDGALLLGFELPSLPKDALVEAHLLLRLPETSPAPQWVRVHPMASGWDERSTTVADALAAVGPVESETRRSEPGPDLVRLHLSTESVLRQRELGFAVRTDPTLDVTRGTRLAEIDDDGPRLELYVRAAPATDRLTAPARPR